MTRKGPWTENVDDTTIMCSVYRYTFVCIRISLALRGRRVYYIVSSLYITIDINFVTVKYK